MNNQFDLTPKKASVILIIVFLLSISIFLIVYLMNPSNTDKKSVQINIKNKPKIEKPLTKDEMEKRMEEARKKAIQRFGTSSVLGNFNYEGKSDEEIRKIMNDNLIEAKKEAIRRFGTSSVSGDIE